MSRLIDELNRVVRAAPQPMGFRATRPDSSKLRILLIASLSKIQDPDHLVDSVDGADAILLRPAKPSLAVNTLQKIATSLTDIPWGGCLGDDNTQNMETLIKAGCDFVVFPETSRFLATPQDDKVGKILQVKPSLGDGLLRAVNDMPLDAVLAAGHGRDVDLRAVCFREGTDPAVQAFLEDVCHGPELRRPLGRERLARGTGPPSPAANQRHLDRIVFAGITPRRQRTGQRRARQ